MVLVERCLGRVTGAQEAAARDLFRRQETRDLPQDHDYSVLRRSLNYALGDAARAVGVLVRQIGGVRTLRDYPGSGRDPMVPTDAATQRRALQLIAAQLLAAREGVSEPLLRLADWLDIEFDSLFPVCPI